MTASARSDVSGQALNAGFLRGADVWMSEQRFRRMTLHGGWLPVGAGAAKLPFTEMRGLHDDRFRQTLGIAILGQFQSVDLAV